MNVRGFKFTKHELELYLLGRLRLHTNPYTGKTQLIPSKPRGRMSARARAVRKLEYLQVISRRPVRRLKLRAGRAVRTTKSLPAPNRRPRSLLRRIAEAWVVLTNA